MFELFSYIFAFIKRSEILIWLQQSELSVQLQFFPPFCFISLFLELRIMVLVSKSNFWFGDSRGQDDLYELRWRDALTQYINVLKKTSLEVTRLKYP